VTLNLEEIYGAQRKILSLILPTSAQGERHKLLTQFNFTVPLP